MSLDEMFDDIVRHVTSHKFTSPDGWFFPGDIVPHGNRFKYKCKVLYSAGRLERQGTRHDRWGYRYRIPNESCSCEHSTNVDGICSNCGRPIK